MLGRAEHAGNGDVEARQDLFNSRCIASFVQEARRVAKPTPNIDFASRQLGSQLSLMHHSFDLVNGSHH